MTALLVSLLLIATVSWPAIRLGGRLRTGLARRRQARQIAADRVRGLPGVVALLQIATAAGMSPRAAISAAGKLTFTEGELATVIADLEDVTRRLALGADLAAAITQVEASVSPSIVRVLEVLRRAEVDGVALGIQLEIVVQDLRRERTLALDIAAQRLTVSLLFPLVICILPAFVLLAVVPLLLGAFSNLPG